MSTRQADQPVRARRPWVRLATTLLLTAAMFAGAGLCLESAITQGDATSRAHAGKGRPGTFTADVRRCGRTCSWYGGFTADGLAAPDARDRELRGAHESSVRAGQRIRVRDVGRFVQAEGGKAEWGSTVANSMGTFVLGVLGILGGVSATVLWNRGRRLDQNAQNAAVRPTTWSMPSSPRRGR
ncbi:hypothetical protein [Actinomadura oligospora]|uniref:hypothetical protein n=1 Tax=Actinomadura oligospora TaxID=111804 RepID=UPI0004B2ABA7|nr:hypothetical protein [Actinomadura oligospora]